MVGEDVDVNIKKLDAHDVAKYVPLLFLLSSNILFSAPTSHSAVNSRLTSTLTPSRILRQENYLIALFNKDLLDLRFRFPLPHSIAPHIPTRFIAPSTELPTNVQERKYFTLGGDTLTKSLGCLNLLFSTFIVVYLLIYSFFRYFEVCPSFLSHPHSFTSTPILMTTGAVLCPGGLSLLHPGHLPFLHHHDLPACPLLGDLPALLTSRNTTKTPHPLDQDNTPHTHNGNSVNSTNSPIYSRGGWIGVILLLKNILISFQRRGLL
jgi:hypothetical protein